ncbi:uncharacterized [Tachysurus ichikawai]
MTMKKSKQQEKCMKSTSGLKEEEKRGHSCRRELRRNALLTPSGWINVLREVKRIFSVVLLCRVTQG